MKIKLMIIGLMICSLTNCTFEVERYKVEKAIKQCENNGGVDRLIVSFDIHVKCEDSSRWLRVPK